TNTAAKSSEPVQCTAQSAATAAPSNATSPQDTTPSLQADATVPQAGTATTPDSPPSPLSGRKFDLIVSNPPYLTDAEWLVADPEVKDHEPYGALVAPEDGLADLRKIICAAPQFLASGGLLALETGI